MKKIGMMLLISHTLWGLPTHSPNRPTYFHDDLSLFDACDPCFSWREALNWRIGYYGDFVYNRDMKRRQYGHQAGIVQRVAFATNGGTLTVNAADWFEFFTMLGATKFLIQTPNKEDGAESLTLFSPSFSWSIGMRGTIWKYRDLAFGFSGQYFRTYTRADSFLDYRGGTSTSFNDNPKTPFYEWMASFGTSYTLSGTTMTFIPHAALTASAAKMGFSGLTFVNDGTTHQLFNLKSQKMWGWALGFTWLMQPCLGVTAEARLADQKALHLAGELAF